MQGIKLKICKVKDEEINFKRHWVQETSWKESHGWALAHPERHKTQYRWILMQNSIFQMQKRQGMVSKEKKNHLFTFTSILRVPCIYESFLFCCTQSFCSLYWMISCWANFESTDSIKSMQGLALVNSTDWILTFGLLSSKKKRKSMKHQTKPRTCLSPRSYFLLPNMDIAPSPVVWSFSSGSRVCDCLVRELILELFKSGTRTP